MTNQFPKDHPWNRPAFNDLDRRRMKLARLRERERQLRLAHLRTKKARER